MSNHVTQETIDKHHRQVASARLRKLQKQYDREQSNFAYHKKMKAFGIAWEVFKAVYMACVILVLVSSAIYCIKVLYGI